MQSKYATQDLHFQCICTLTLANQARLQMYATEVREPRFESRRSHEKEP